MLHVRERKERNGEISVKCFRIAHHAMNKCRHWRRNSVIVWEGHGMGKLVFKCFKDTVKDE